MLKLLRRIFKRYPEPLPDNYTAFINMSLMFMALPFPELAEPATLTVLYASMHPPAVEIYMFRLLKQFYLNFGTCPDHHVLAVCLKSCTVLIRQAVPVSAALSALMAKFAIDAMYGPLSDSRPRNFPPPTCPFLTECFYAFMRMPGRMGLAFSLAQLICHVRVLAECEDQLFSLSRWVAVLRDCYEHCPNPLDSAQASIVPQINDVFRKFVDSFHRVDSPCFCIEPAPIDALTSVLQRDPHAIHDILIQALGFMSGVLTSPNDGQCFFWETITSASAFVCEFLRTSTDASAFTNYLPLLLSRLPIRTRWEWANTIYWLLFRIFEQRETFGADEDIRIGIVKTRD
jgi:hypothetical protein